MNAKAFVDDDVNATILMLRTPLGHFTLPERDPQCMIKNVHLRLSLKSMKKPETWKGLDLVLCRNLET